MGQLAPMGPFPSLPTCLGWWALMVVAGQCLTVEGRWVYPTPHTQLLVGRRVTRPDAQPPQTLTWIILEVVNNIAQLSGRGFPHIFYMKLVLLQLYVFFGTPKWKSGRVISGVNT